MSAGVPSYLEDRISQIPALRLLMAMGWQYLTPKEVNALRDEKSVNVILDEVLLDWLRGNNPFQHKGKTHTFNEQGLVAAMDAGDSRPAAASGVDSGRRADVRAADAGQEHRTGD